MIQILSLNYILYVINHYTVTSDHQYLNSLTTEQWNVVMNHSSTSDKFISKYIDIKRTKLIVTCRAETIVDFQYSSTTLELTIKYSQIPFEIPSTL